MASDLEQAKGFYGELLGWSYDVQEMEAGPYVMIKRSESFIGGMMTRPSPEIPAHWASYVSVPDVAQSITAAEEHGGRNNFGPYSPPGVGTMASISDPEGAAFYVFRAEDGDPPPAQPTGGDFCWETLTTKDLDRALTFYGAVCGWKRGTGPGNVPTFETDGASVADVQTASEGVPSHWLTYVVVQDLASSRERTTALGGNVVVPEIPVEGVGTIALIRDPGGAHIGLFTP
jgi:hypothetical protein